MPYIIGTNSEYIKVHTGNLISEKDEMKVIFKVEYGLNLTESPSIFNDKEVADEILRLIQEQKNDIKFENKNIFGKIFDGNQLDVSKLNVYQIILFDTNKDIILQMKEMIGGHERDLMNVMYGTGYDDGVKAGKIEILNDLKEVMNQWGTSTESISYSTLVKLLDARKNTIESED